MSLFDFHRRGEVVGNYFDIYNRPSSQGTVAVRRFGGGSNVTAQSMTSGGNAGGSYSINRMVPVTDRLDEGSVLEDWIGKDASSIDKMYRLIYLRDTVAGPTVDLMSRLPWSDFVLTGVEDEAAMRIFQDATDALNIVPMLPGITTEYLMLGKMIGSLLWDNSKGYWTGLIAHDPDMVRIEPRPIYGLDPKIDLKLSPGLQKFLKSVDPRDLEAREKIPEEYLKKMQNATNYIPLEPDNTLYIARRVLLYDYLGTSFLTRIVPYWALEKALISSTVIHARRKTKDLLHIKAGIDGVWEPTPQEMDFLTMLFIQAEEDPNGGAVATRTGVEIDSLGGPSSIWKISDEADFLANGKMRALGISEAFLSGDASYNTLEAALSVFIEALGCLRAEITSALLYNRIYSTIAKVHELYQDTPARVAHRIRVKTKGVRDAKLIIPKVVWTKQLRPEADSSYIEILSSAEDKGVPISLKTWAAAAGVDMQTEMANMEEDIKLRKQIAELKGDSGPDAEASVLETAVLGGFRPMAVTAITARKNPQKALRMVPLWDKSDNFLQLSFKEAEKALATVNEHKAWRYKRNGTDNEVIRCVKTALDGNERKTQLMTYVLARLGFGYAKTVDVETTRDITAHLMHACKNNLHMEVRALRKLTGQEAQVGAEEYTAVDKMLEDKGDGKTFNMKDPIPRDSPHVFSGLPIETKKAAEL